MPKAPIAADFDQASDVGLDLAPKVSLDDVVAVDDLTELGDIRIGKVPYPNSRIEPRLLNQFRRVVLADAVDMRQGVQDRLLSGKVYACNTCHSSSFPLRACLALSLLVLGVDAEDTDDALALDDLALVADSLNTRAYFHGSVVPLNSSLH